MKGNNMKMIAKIATCGFLSLALQVAQAESVQLAANAAKKVANAPTAREFVQKNAGINVTATMTTAELAAAIGSSKTLSLGEQIALIKAINSYANVASVDASNPLNESRAVTLLKDQKGQLLQVASLAKDSGTRSGVEQAGTCSKSVDPVKAIEGVKGVSFADAEAAVNAKNVTASLDCNEQIEKMGVKARENIFETGVCMTNRGAQFKDLAARQHDADECLLGAINNDGATAPIDLVAATARRQAQEAKCNLFNTRAGLYKPMARN